MNTPLVSIIIPVYNGENYLKEAIDSALSQTYANVEVIVVNDGSCDDGATERIALSYGNKIKYFCKKNGGVATALNLGIHKMEGEYFSWLSHDDMYYPDKIKRQIQALHEYGDMKALVYSAYDILDVNSKVVTHVLPDKTYPIGQLTDSVFPVLQGLIHGCSLLIHRSHFQRIGIFDESLITTQDYDLWFRMFRYQKTIFISEPLIMGRLHSEQGSRTLACHDLERCQLHIGFLDALSEEEMCSMYGTTYNFYHKMSCFFKGAKMNEAYNYANRRFQEDHIPENLKEQLLSLKKYIRGFSEGKANRICIFCAGEYGIRLYQELHSKLISVDCFSDNNPEKWGSLFDNINCVSPKQLYMEKDHTLVIVANRAPVEIVYQLKSQGYPYITTKQEIDKVLFNVPPVKWVTSLDNIEGLDYTSKDVMVLLNKCNHMIFEISKYIFDKA